MRVLIDAHVLMDALLPDADRPQGDRQNAQLILEAVAKGKLTGVITPVLFAFVVHVVKPRRASHRARVEKALDFLLDIMEWAPVTPDHYRKAMASSFADVEDGAQFFAAGRVGAIITRYTQDFRDHVHVPVYTAAQFVAKHLR
jgi:predicted nucleic acid-binding protein